MDQGRTFTQMWEDAEVRFQERTKKSLKGSKNLGLDDMLKKVDERFNAEEQTEPNGKRERMRGIVSNILKVFEIFGSVAAQGASVVFGPASQCFNALEFLISIPTRIAELYDDIANVFQEIAAFLTKVTVYDRIQRSTTFPVELIESTNKLMITFVDICAISIDLLSSSKRKALKGAFKKALLDDDSGISEKRDEFKRLIDQQGHLSEAINLEHVLETEREVKAGHKQQSIDHEESQKKLAQLGEIVKATKDIVSKRDIDHLGEICDKLEISKDSSKQLDKELAQMNTAFVEQTGHWLQENDQYRRWTDLEQEDEPLLLLKGDSGCGKSFLAYTIIYKLRRQFKDEAENPTRFSFASHRFNRGEKQSRDGAFKIAVKNLAAQVASSNNVYAQKVSSYVKGKADGFSRFMPAADLLQELLPPQTLRDQREMAYFLLFDDLDNLSDDDADLLLSSTFAENPAKMRILLTATDQSLSACLTRIGKSPQSIPTISIAEHNEPDLTNFVGSKIQACKALQRHTPEFAEIRTHIHDNLPRKAKGRFRHVQLIIDKVQEAIDSDLSKEEVKACVDVDPSIEQDQAIERYLTDLNRSLKKQEIEQLNELLIWTMYAFRLMNKQDMEAALFLCTKRHSLQTVEEKIKKYDQLLEINEDEDFVMQDNGWEDFFRASQRLKHQSGTEIDNDPRITMKITIDRVRQSMVRTWIWNMNKEVVLDDFKFASSLADIEPAEQASPISANSTEAHLRLARRCLEVVLEPELDTDRLGPYALQFLPAHLAKLREQENLELLEPSEREIVFRDLVSLLQSPECIEYHMSNLFFLSMWWLNDEDLRAVQAWLKDEHAGQLDRKTRKWLKHADSTTGLIALRDVALMVTRHWLCLDKWEAWYVFTWVDDYLHRVANSESETKNKDEAPNDDNATGEVGVQKGKYDISLQERVQRAMKWAENEAKITKNAFLYKRVGDTYREQSEPKLAIEAYTTGKAHPDCHWTLLGNLAEAYWDNDQKLMAVQEIEIIILQLRDMVDRPIDEATGLVDNLLMSARWQVQLNNTSNAIDKLEEAISLDYKHLQSRYTLFKTLLNTHNDSEALNQLHAMANELVKDDLNLLDSLLLDMAYWSDYWSNYWSDDTNDDPFEVMFRAATFPDMLKLITESLQKASKHAMEAGYKSEQVPLSFCFGKILARHSTKEDHFQCARQQWSTCRELGWKSESWYDRTLALKATRYIFNYYFSEFRSGRYKADDFRIIYQDLESLTANIPSEWHSSRLRIMLSSFHCYFGDRDEARKMLSNDLQNSLDLLSDDDPDNDQTGYRGIAQGLMHVGDDLNALSAWSLCGPAARLKSDDPLGWSCDGCGKILTYADRVWSCKICDDVDFHDDCLDKLKKGTLPRLICNSDHDWLRIPPWQDEYEVTGDGVRMGGEIKDGERIGGTIVPVKEWLNAIREEWGFPTMEPAQKEESEEKDERTA